MRMGSRWGRVLRGWSAASFAIIAAAVSHTAAGGAAPTVFSLAVSLVIAGMLCTILAGAAVSWVRLTVSIGVSQFLFHGLFSGLGTPVSVEHVHGAATMIPDAAATPHHDGSMWLAHAAAGLATLVAFRYGESAFWGLAATATLLFARLIGVFVPVEPSPAPAVAFHATATLPRLAAVLLSSMSHRGPPLAARA